LEIAHFSEEKGGRGGKKNGRSRSARPSFVFLKKKRRKEEGGGGGRERSHKHHVACFHLPSEKKRGKKKRKKKGWKPLVCNTIFIFPEKRKEKGGRRLGISSIPFTSPGGRRRKRGKKRGMQRSHLLRAILEIPPRPTFFFGGEGKKQRGKEKRREGFASLASFPFRRKGEKKKKE